MVELEVGVLEKENEQRGGRTQVIVPESGHRAPELGERAQCAAINIPSTASTAASNSRVQSLRRISKHAA